MSITVKELKAVVQQGVDAGFTFRLIHAGLVIEKRVSAMPEKIGSGVLAIDRIISWDELTGLLDVYSLVLTHLKDCNNMLRDFLDAS